ncbi:MAG: class II glutamine amidotransferase [Planctomycetes bacterium]|nr:class II glutamine amidotransferase [Planctomycetota bacterium]
MASVGKQSIENTHPFTHGRWTFAHNGTVTAFDRLGPQLVTETSPHLQNCRKGSTDSEQVFYWLLSRMHGTCMSPDGQHSDFSAMVAVFAESLQVLAKRCEEAGVGELERLNFLLTDGEVLLASRWNNSLYWVFREGIRDCEICGIPHVQNHLDSEYRAVVVASEPISQEAWQEVPEATILAVDAAIQPQMHPVSSDESKSAAR